MDCPHEKVTGLERANNACSDCVGKILKDYDKQVLHVENLTKERDELREKIRQYNVAWEAEELLRSAQKAGETAAGRGASLEDNPYDKDSDLAAVWSYGFVSASVVNDLKRMQALLAWIGTTLVTVREVALGGASGDEVSAKLETILEKIVDQLPDPEEESA
jgi:hypothetical protein